MLWLLPLALLMYALSRIWTLRAGEPGDYYLYGVLGRLQLSYPQGIPSLIPDLHFPEGQARSIFPALFSEPLMFTIIGMFTRLAGDPTLGVWLTIVSVVVFNILGTWIFFWKRFSRTSLLAVVVGWCVIAFLPWWWSRSSIHVHLSWVTLLLVCIGIWFDFFVEKKTPRLWFVALVHFLLISQSLYFGVFMILFVVAWSLAFAPDHLRNPQRLKQLGGLALGAGVGYGLDLIWVIASYGGIAAMKIALSTGNHPDPGMAYVYSNRVRELIRGAPGSPSDWIVAQLGKPYTHGVDAEGFPAPFPKMALILCGIVFLYARSFRQFKGAPTRGTSWFLWATLLGVALMGMQEITWIKFNVLFPVFPFIRSYSRMFLVMMLVFALWFAKVAERYEGAAQRSPKALTASFAVWFAALFLDYGWDWKPHLISSFPCATYMSEIANHPFPVFSSGRSPHPSDCARDSSHIFAVTGAPVILGYGEDLPADLRPNTQECVAYRSRLIKAHESKGSVWWWFEGNEADLDRSLKCLKPARLEVVLLETSAEGTQNRLSQIGF